MSNGWRRLMGSRGIVVVALLAMVVAGCASTRKGAQMEGSTKDERNKPLYYDFGDVLIPSELKLDREASFVFQTPAMTAGVLSMRGRVTMPSLIQFFESNMRKDNWQPVSSFKSVRTIMLYQKENRWCVINISEGAYNTLVEVWVAPTTHEPTSFRGGMSGDLSEGSLLK
ncbi:MAG: hypothetical protein LJE65_01190 [Desulfobacteraceae bacterium]|nr:hypothetical protein [Desulfobacteraceae bacterium]